MSSHKKNGNTTLNRGWNPGNPNTWRSPLQAQQAKAKAKRQRLRKKIRDAEVKLCHLSALIACWRLELSNAS